MADEEKRTGGIRWGDSISEERQAELKVLADQQREWAEMPEAERGDSYFKGAHLTGADVFWLAAYAHAGPGGDIVDSQHTLRLISHVLRAVPDVPALHLEEADLSYAHLERAQLSRAHLERARLFGAYLKKATIMSAHLDGANLDGADLRGATFWGATLNEARFYGARLKHASLEMAELKEADLNDADLGDAYLVAAGLERANLKGATFDTTTRLDGAIFTGAKLDQVIFDNTNLAGVDWSLVPILGDEVEARYPEKRLDGKPINREVHLELYQSAVRANRSLAAALRTQGLNEHADRYAYRAQVLQREVLRRQAFERHTRFPVGFVQRLRMLTSSFGSLLMDLIAGYGYRPGRSILAYIVIICAFAGLYLLNGHFASPHLRWDEALVLSISSFHGRGFFTSGVSLGDTLARLAAGEAVVGLLLEITFITTFTNRFFAR